MLVRKVSSPNWYTPEGVRMKRAWIENKGMPNLKDWRFITLTIDPDEYGELDGYLAGKDRMRRFLFAVRDLLGCEEGVKWCWKLEFQRNGMPHWHIAFDYRSRLTFVELQAMSYAWGLGRVNVKRIKDGTLDYFFKYVSKESYQGEPGDDDVLPCWFMDYMEEPLEGGKPRTFSRVRFWQASKGFYTGKPSKPVEKKEPKSSMMPLTVREVVEARRHTVQVSAQDAENNTVRSRNVRLCKPWHGAGNVSAILATLAIMGDAAVPDNQSYITTAEIMLELSSCPTGYQTNRVKELLPWQTADEGAQIQAWFKHVLRGDCPF